MSSFSLLSNTPYYVLYNVRSEGNRFVLPSGEEFNAWQYSSLKFGSAIAASDYGTQIAQELPSWMADCFGPNPDPALTPILVSNPPFEMDHAARRVTRWCHRRINRYRRDRGLGEIESAEIKRLSKSVTSNTKAYGSLDAAGRKTWITENPVLLQQGSVQGKVVILIDDLLVTGKTGEQLSAELYDLGATEVRLVYVAQIDPAQAEQNPALEATLNRFKIHTLDDLVAMWKTGPWVPTPWALRLLLDKNQDQHDVRKVAGAMTKGELKQICWVVKAEGYNLRSEYQDNCAVVFDVARERSVTIDQQEPDLGRSLI